MAEPFHTYCDVCRLPFTAIRADARLCSPTCRSRAARARRAAERADALDLLRRHAEVMSAGVDLFVLSGIAREAEALLGAARVPAAVER